MNVLLLLQCVYILESYKHFEELNLESRQLTHFTELSLVAMCYGVLYFAQRVRLSKGSYEN